MYTHISVEMITKQKFNELRNQAEMYKLGDQMKAGGQESRSLAARLFPWLFKTTTAQQENKQKGRKRTARVQRSIP